MFLDDVTFGNPNKEQFEYIKSESYLCYLFEELKTYKFPKNESEATKEELNEIVTALNNIEGKDKFLERYIMYDRNIQRYFIDGLVKGGENEIEVTDMVKSITEDIKPLLFKLKFHHNRPRPKQLADYYMLKLFPYKSTSADSPSFPSGHSFEAKLFTEVIGNRYPKTYATMQKVFRDICYSRLYLGLHYQSDIDVGIFCAEKVLSDKAFKEKYKL